MQTDGLLHEKLRDLLDEEKRMYNQAIKDGKEFYLAKQIYLRIKQLRRMLTLCTQQSLS